VTHFNATVTMDPSGLTPVQWQLPAWLIELGLMPNERCSGRTGLCGNGPVALPVQQTTVTGAAT
jgi:hypothetical protein